MFYRDPSRSDDEVLFKSATTRGESAGQLGCGVVLLFFFFFPLVIGIVGLFEKEKEQGDWLATGVLLVLGLPALWGLVAIADSLVLLVRPREMLRATRDGLLVYAIGWPRRSFFVPWHHITAITMSSTVVKITRSGSRRTSEHLRRGVELRLAPESGAIPPRGFRYFEVAEPHALVLTADHGDLQGSELAERLRRAWHQVAQAGRSRSTAE